MTDPLFPLLNLCRLRMGTDGVGVTTLVAGAGCPLNCRFCINSRLLHDAPAEEVTAEELLERVEVDDLYFRATGGGITFGGGEALLHADFIRHFRELCPGEWRISVETSLAVPEDLVRMALEAVDQFIVDCKDMDPEIYRSYTGGDEALMESNLRLLLEEAGAARILVRVPRIPDFNTNDDQMRNMNRLCGMGVKNLDIFEYVVKEN